MKKIILGLAFLSGFVRAQNGLENVIVEKYYISNAADSIVNDGVAANPGDLSVGSVTYRIYVDMLPGYKFQAAYGNTNHPLLIGTSTTFFNNEDRGATTPTYTKTQAKDNTVMLDSWLSVGAACAGNFGILKADDNGVATNVNSDGVLQNTVTAAGIPLTIQDGLITSTVTLQAVTTLGIDTEIAVFDATSNVGNLFMTTGGTWSALNGATGPTADNRVLIAQITTNGNFSFELNIQIGTPVGGVENYVAKNPAGSEILLASLTYTVAANVAPTVSITSPTNSATFTAGNIVTIKADAADADGTVSSVEFFVNGASIGSDVTVPYQYNWTSVAGTSSLTAVATDNLGAKTTSTLIVISVITTTANIAPTVSITSPLNGASFTTGTVVVIMATAADADGTVSSVEFFVDGVTIGSDATAPYQFNWTSVAGTHSLTAVATDNISAQTTSSIVTITVSTSPNGINDLNSSDPLYRIYPNPTKDFFTIEITSSRQSTVSYTIYNVQGNVIFYKEHKDIGFVSGKYVERIDISSFANGQYIIVLSLDGTISTKQIIKN